MKQPLVLLFALASSLMVITAGFLLWLKANQQLGKPGVKLDLPLQVLEYQSVEMPITPAEKNTLPKDTSFAVRLYSRVQNSVTNHIQLRIVLMGTDRTSIHKPQFCLVGQGWNIKQSELKQIPMQRPHAYSLPVMKLTSSQTVRLENGQKAALTGLYVYWFVADEKLTATHWQRMWWMAKNLMTTGVLQRWAYISCFAVCRPGTEEALYDELCRFITAAAPEFQLAAGPALAVETLSSPETGRQAVRQVAVSPSGAE
jgi:hypothetical protein